MLTTYVFIISYSWLDRLEETCLEETFLLSSLIFLSFLVSVNSEDEEDEDAFLFMSFLFLILLAIVNSKSVKTYLAS